MSDVVIFDRMQQRRGTAADLAAVNEVLRDGEYCVESDTGFRKVGDGTTAWNDLSYLDAAATPFDNAASGLAATQVQAAIDELADEKIDEAPNDGNEYVRKDEAWALATASTGMTLVGTATVAGAAATTLTLSGLNLAAHGRYIIEYNFLNATASQAVISAYLNGDTTDTNYDNENIQSSGSTTTAARANAPTVGVLNASSTCIGVMTVRTDRNGKASIEWEMRTGETTTITKRHGVTMWRTAANVTSITLSSSVASAFSIGDYFKVWKLPG
jgi:hypothetical protein